MIAHLTGRLLRCTPDTVLLDVGGVGYALRIPLGTYYALAENRTETVGLHVFTHLRSDALTLFGFSTVEEREAFERLIGISGIGPRIALAILSGIGAADLERAVLEEDRSTLERIPGIGRKTAARLLLELKDRYRGGSSRPGRGAVPSGDPGPAVGGARSDALSALANLGYATDRAVRAVDRALEELGGEVGLQDLLRASLRHLMH